jgi:hypothetical protein
MQTMTYTLSTRPSFLRAAATLSSAIVAFGWAEPVFAQSSRDDLARCQQLYGLWSRHTTTGYAKNPGADLALEDCRKGNIAVGVAELTRILQRAQITVPPAETAASPQAPQR